MQTAGSFRFDLFFGQRETQILIGMGSVAGFHARDLALGVVSAASALNYQPYLDNEATFETLEEALVNGPAYLSEEEHHHPGVHRRPV